MTPDSDMRASQERDHDPLNQAQRAGQQGGGGGGTQESPYLLRKRIVPTNHYSPSIHNSASRREMRSPSTPSNSSFPQFSNTGDIFTVGEISIGQFADAPDSFTDTGGNFVPAPFEDPNVSFNEHLGLIHADELGAMCIDPSTLSLSANSSAPHTPPVPLLSQLADQQERTSDQIEESDEQADDSLPHAPEAPDEQHVSVEETSSQPSGRISATIQKKLYECFTQIEEIVSKTALETGRTPDGVLLLWRHADAKRKHVRNTWNIYQNVYFPKNLERERQRVPGVPEPTAGQCWRLFKEEVANWQEILAEYESLANMEASRISLQSRAHKFKQFSQTLESAAREASTRHGFEALVIAVGNSIHQDSSLCYTYESPGASNFLKERFRTDEAGMTAILRNHVCDLFSREFEQEMVGEIAKQISTASAASATSKGQGKSGKGKMKAKAKAPGDSEAEAAADAEEALVLAKIVADQGASGDDYEDNEQSGGKAPSLATLTGIRTTIKTRLAGILQPCGITLCKGKILEWSSVTAKLLTAGVCIENWVPGVAFPPADIQGNAKKQGIKDIGVRYARTLAEGLADNSINTRAKFVNKEDLKDSKIPIYIEAPPRANSNDACGRRMFANGFVDNKGPARLKPKDDDVVELSSSSEPIRPTRSKSKRRPSRSSEGAADTESSDDEPLWNAALKKKTALMKKTASKKKKPVYTILSDEEQPASEDQASDDEDEPAALDLRVAKVKQEKGHAAKSSVRPIDPPALRAVTALPKKNTNATNAQPAATSQVIIHGKAAPAPAIRKVVPRPIKKPAAEATTNSITPTPSQVTTFSGSAESAESHLGVWKGERTLLPIHPDKVAEKFAGKAVEKAVPVVQEQENPNAQPRPQRIPAVAASTITELPAAMGDEVLHLGPLKGGPTLRPIPVEKIAAMTALAAQRQGTSIPATAIHANPPADPTTMKKPSAFGPQRLPSSFPDVQGPPVSTSNVKRGANDDCSDTGASKKKRMNSGVASRVPSMEKEQTTPSNAEGRTTSDHDGQGRQSLDCEGQDSGMEDPNLWSRGHRPHRPPLAPRPRRFPSDQPFVPENPSQYPGAKRRAESNGLDSHDYEMGDPNIQWNAGYYSREPPPPTPRLAPRLPPRRENEDRDRQDRQSQDRDIGRIRRNQRFPSVQSFPPGSFYPSDEYYDHPSGPNRNPYGLHPQGPDDEGRERGRSYYPRPPPNTAYGYYPQFDFYDPHQRQDDPSDNRGRRDPSAEGV